ELLRLRQLRIAGLLADDQPTRLPGDRVDDLRALRLERRGGLVAREALQRPRDHICLPRERPLDRLQLVADREAQPEGAQVLDEPPVCVVCKPFRDRLRALRADALDLLDLLLRGAEQPVDILEVAREVDGRDPADVRDVEAEEYAVERDLLRRLDRLDRVRRGNLAEAVDLQQLLLRQTVKLRDGAHEPELPELPPGLLADASDIGRGLDPVDQRLEPARRTRLVRTAVHRLALWLDDVRAAQGALFRHLERLRAGLVLARRADDLRDDVPGALHDDDVALADVLAVDVLLIVQRCARDGDAADLDRLEHRPRVERARAADADRDLVQPRRRRHPRPLRRARPARPLVQRAEPTLLLERIDLDHDAVDLVVELDPLLLPFRASARHRLDRVVQ